MNYTLIFSQRLLALGSTTKGIGLRSEDKSSRMDIELNYNIRVVQYISTRVAMHEYDKCQALARLTNWQRSFR